MSSRIPRNVAVMLGAILVVFASGCFAYHGPRGVESALEEQMGVGLEREFGLKLGWTSTKIVGALVGHDGDEDALALGDLTGIGVVTYTIPEGAKRPRLDPAKLGLRGWDVAFRARDGEDDVVLLTRSRAESIHEMLLVAYDGDEVSVVRLRGRLDDLLAKALSEGEREGSRGVRGTVNVAAKSGARDRTEKR